MLLSPYVAIMHCHNPCGSLSTLKTAHSFWLFTSWTLSGLICDQIVQYSIGRFRSISVLVHAHAFGASMYKSLSSSASPELNSRSRPRDHANATFAFLSNMRETHLQNSIYREDISFSNNLRKSALRLCSYLLQP